MKRMFAIGLALSTIALTAPHVNAQSVIDGFTRGAGKTDVVLGFSSAGFDSFFLGQQEVDNPPPFREVTTVTGTLFIAHGLTDNIDLIVNLPYVSISAEGDGSMPDQSGLQDLGLHAKWRPWRRELTGGALTLVVSGGVEIPLTDYEVNSVVVIGHGSTNVDGRALLQYQWHGGMFAELQSGYIRRGDDVPDAVPVQAKLGYGTNRFYADAFYALERSEDSFDIGDPGFTFPETQVDFDRIGGSLFFHLNGPASIGVGASTTLDGRNVRKDTVYRAAVVYRLGR